jgi:hypothetical protein
MANNAPRQATPITAAVAMYHIMNLDRHAGHLILAHAARLPHPGHFIAIYPLIEGSKNLIGNA